MKKPLINAFIAAVIATAGTQAYGMYTNAKNPAVQAACNNIANRQAITDTARTPAGGRGGASDGFGNTQRASEVDQNGGRGGATKYGIVPSRAVCAIAKYI